jgi:DNA-3-methyladenine glycosylase
MKPADIAMHRQQKNALAHILASSRILDRLFYERPTVEVARDLLGKILIHGSTAGRIVETEAYLGEHDMAAHASHGVTPRTRVLFGPPGHAYVFLIYGMHYCLNLVAEPDGIPGCVLLRALEPLAGIDIMLRRRPQASSIHDLASGPGKLTRAMGITRRHNGMDVTQGELTVRALTGDSFFEVATGGRIGIRHCRDWPLRFFICGNPSVSR